MKIEHLVILIFLILIAASCKRNDRGVISIQASIGNAAPVIFEEKDTVGLDYIIGKFEQEKNRLFIEIPLKYADRPGLYLRKEVLKDFMRMYEAALTEGIKLQIRSATRNFNYQKEIWEAKWTGKTILSDGINASSDIDNDTERALKILEYSSMPGTSRHHWGTDIDLNAFNNKWFESGEGLRLYEWLQSHAADYGFCQPYTTKDISRPEGYNEEKWHWSYTPLSSEILRAAESKLSNEMITGFMGAEQAPEIDVVNKYILGVNKECK